MRGGVLAPKKKKKTKQTAQALMLLMSWALPCDVSVPSFSRMMPGCCQGSERTNKESDMEQRESERMLPRLQGGG